MVKPTIDDAAVLKMLGGLFNVPVDGLAPVGTGQIARAFSFRAGADQFIVRFVDADMATSFGKDQLVAEKLSSSSIPVPEIMLRGTHRDLHYAISRKVQGVPSDELSAGELELLAPSMIETLHAIHQVDVTKTKGYGPFDEHGVGMYASWAASLTSVAEEGDEDSFYGKWHRMFDESFLDREYFDDILARMTELLRYCPEERYLVHADFGFGNVLAQDGKITAVLDWAEARYGDFLYDVAWLDLGLPDMDFQSRFQAFYGTKGCDVPHYEERIACYQFYMSLDSQRWYGKTGQSEANEWMKGRIARVIRGLDGK